MPKLHFKWSREITVPLGLSLALHVVLVTVLLAGLNFSSLTKPKQVLQVSLNNPEAPLDEMPQDSEVVEAVTFDQAQVDAQIAAIQQAEAERKAAEERRIRELERRAEEAKRQREAEQRKQRELAAQQEAERKRLAQEQAAAKAERERIEREKREAEAAAKAAEEKRKREEEAARKAAEERERLERERQQREREAREKAERERQLQERLAQEAAARRTARMQQIQSELDRYTVLIQQTIQRNFNRDESMRGKQCELTISLSPSGFVKSVTTGSGDTAVCNAAQTAVLRAGTLPVSEDREVYEQMSVIKLTFAPEF
ncbi:cell envelope integrity protein TolA [Pseudidiomarina taiwanensis]|uniref:Protein TolA n=1 Tax=Pseudidiomarina taiwanensis TaxID=337250 RepID=A0A432ZK28_9GAMM|nr:cell envelope integrity protein TolA [Pseudidiomarina taiwanensis]RUO78326.1 protein TolA [Pseudidiomarina taiwanensis]